MFCERSSSRWQTSISFTSGNTTQAEASFHLQGAARAPGVHVRSYVWIHAGVQPTKQPTDQRTTQKHVTYPYRGTRSAGTAAGLSVPLAPCLFALLYIKIAFRSYSNESCGCRRDRARLRVEQQSCHCAQSRPPMKSEARPARSLRRSLARSSTRAPQVRHAPLGHSRATGAHRGSPSASQPRNAECPHA